MGGQPRLGLAPDRSWEMNQPPAQFQFQSTPSALLWEQASIRVLLMSRVRASHSPLVSPTGLPTSQEGSSSFRRTPGLGHPICGSNGSLSREGLHPCSFPFPLSPFPGAHKPHYFSSLPTSFPVDLSYSFDCTGIILPVSS